MHTLSEPEFLDWASARGMALDSRYPQSAVLSFAADAEASRFWEVPAAAERRPFFLASVLGLMGDWKVCFVWRHLGSWPDAKHLDPQRVNDTVEYKILAGLGLPMGTTDVVAFERTDAHALLTLLFSTTVFGWSVGEDLYVVPDSGQVIVQTDHHEVVHVTFRAAADVDPAVRHMEAAGFPLPDELPDETFKPQAWLKGDEA